MGNVVLIAAGTLTALLAGLMFCFAVAIMPGLKRSPDREMLRAMQNINRAIVNPVFMLSFLGPVLLLPLATWMKWDEAGGLLLAASVAHIVGGVGVTAAKNLPLNDRVDKVDLDKATDKEVAEIRGWYEQPWKQWHLVRTVATILGTIATFAAALSA